MASIPVKKADNKGRITFGPEYANKQFFVFFVRPGRSDTEGMIQLLPAETVPAREAWLFKNPTAIEAVMEGLKQAREGELCDGPDMDAAEAFANQIEDE